MNCPMCNSDRTPKGRMTCIDCGYMALAFMPIRVNRRPSTEKLRRCVQLMLEGMTPYRAAKEAGVRLSTATNAMLRYIVVPEWAEFKADQEQYAALDAPNQKAA